MGSFKQDLKTHKRTLKDHAKLRKLMAQYPDIVDSFLADHEKQIKRIQQGALSREVPVKVGGEPLPKGVVNNEQPERFPVPVPYMPAEQMPLSSKLKDDNNE